MGLLPHTKKGLPPPGRRPLYMDKTVLFHHPHSPLRHVVRHVCSCPVVAAQVDVEDQVGVGGDAAVALRRTAVAQLIGNVYNPVVANVHVLQCRGETVYHSAHDEMAGTCRLLGIIIAIPALIEHKARGITRRRDELALIVYQNRVGVERTARTGALLHHAHHDAVRGLAC